MPIRITGMNSGLDTESIITELVKAQKTKVDSVKKKQTALQWKQDAWKTLNTKIHNLFQKTLGNMRLSTDYSKKVTDVSNTSIAKVVSADSAMNATQELVVNKLAQTGYMTGDELAGNITKDSVITDASGLGIAVGSTISVSTGGKTKEITIGADTTMNGLLTALRDAGVEANFDEKNKRLHIAAKKAGEKNDFTITASNDAGTDALRKLGILNYDTAAINEYKKYANMTETEKQAAIDSEVKKRLASYTSQWKNLQETRTKQDAAVTAAKDSFEQKYGDLETALQGKDDLKQKIEELEASIKDAPDGDDKKAKTEELQELQSKMAALEEYETSKKALDATDASLRDVEKYLDTTDKDNITASTALNDQVKQELETKITTAQGIVNAGSTLQGSKVQKTQGQNAEIELNGVTYKGESNTFEVNGLTITALQASTEKVTLTTRQDTDGVYNMIKNFLKEYNALINEMDKLYNAESSKGYDPLTDEEKDEMTDSEIEKWETKIKDSILRGDSNLSTISSAMKNIMLKGVTVNGKQMYLSSFGIETLGYFTSAENEKNAYHINGDEDDSAVSSKENELKAAIAADPDTVIAFFSQLSQNLYTELNNQSRSMDGIRSFGSFYDDKRMKDEYDSYKTKIKQQEEKLTAMEDKWYKKFSAMETALARMQSNQSAVASLLGG